MATRRKKIFRGRALWGFGAGASGDLGGALGIDCTEAGAGD